MQLFHRKPDGPPAIVIAVVCGLVAAGAECAIARPSEYDCTDILVVACLVQGLDQLIASLATERVHLLRSIDNDPGNAVADFIDEIFELHLLSP